MPVSITAAVCWLPQGALSWSSSDEPQNADVSKAMEAATALLGRKVGVCATVDELMEGYDEEDDRVQVFGNGGLGCCYYKPGEKDPQLNEDEDDEEADDEAIRESDLLLVSASTEHGIGSLEFSVYEGDNHMYPHHEILLSAPPLCLALLPAGGDEGNFLAVGSMKPGIEIWDLDKVDEIEPAVEVNEGGETSAPTSQECLGLSWNKEYRNFLASANGDGRVRIWNTEAQKCQFSLSCHSKEVQSVAWHPSEPACVLSGSFDHSAVLTDVRSRDSGVRWVVAKPVECLAWNPHSSHAFAISSRDGLVHGFDARKASGSGTSDTLFKVQAHDKATCALSYNLVTPNLLATASTDKTVKLWDLKNDASPLCISSKASAVGKVFAVSFCMDAPSLLAVGGSKVEVWDTSLKTEVDGRFLP